MDYRTLIVSLDIDCDNTGLLHVATELADRFDADVIGSATYQQMQLVYGDGYISGDVVQKDIAEIEKALVHTQEKFRSAFGKRSGRIEWHAALAFGPLSDVLVKDARSADLIISRADGADQNSSARHVSCSDLVMQAGRPVLLVPEKVTTLPLHRVLVGWKDTKETRRAIADSLPLLRAAHSVILAEWVIPAEVAVAKLRLEKVVMWLKRHGITAESHAIATNGDHRSDLLRFAESRDVDLIVAGAYGHSRLREWVLGGVTRDLLSNTHICSLMSH